MRILALGMFGFSFLAASAMADEIESPTAVRFTGVAPASSVERYAAPQPDADALQAEDIQREADGLPPRYAVPNVVDITPRSHGMWEILDDGSHLWRLRIGSPGAKSINLGFTEYFMPEGGRLQLYSANLKQVIRPFTAKDNASHGELWTPQVFSDEIVVEVTLPGPAEADMRLKLGSINVGYRDFLNPQSFRSGACNVDVVCPEGNDWLNEIPSVGAISTGGSIFCTGFMVNNTAGDRKPYFMTAAHCGVGAGNAASLVVYWNFETTPCGGTPNGSLADFQTGAFFRSSYSASDFTLVELDEDPDPAWGVTFAGWDRTSADAPAAIAIHHPSGDEKRISFEDDPTFTTSYLSNTVPGNGTHIRVVDWDLGTTEPGSSGSPLFSPNHHVIGQLHGGYASCSSQTSDWYGRFSVSWTGGGTAASRLSDWLDPLGTGQTTLDTLGIGPAVVYQGNMVDDTSGNGDGIADPGESLILPVTAKNVGSFPATSIGGTLSTPTGGVTIVDGLADWPDLGPQQSAVSNAPHFEIAIDSGFTCGDSIDLQVDYSANEGNWSSLFGVQVGVANVTTDFADDMESGANGWVGTPLVGTNNWSQVTNRSNSPVTSWFISDIPTVSDAVLVSPTLTALPAAASLRFQQYVASESNFDGGVLEYSTDGTTWIDAGGLIVVGGYNSTISTSYSSPIGGRGAWSGSSGGWTGVEVDLSSLAGSDVAFRWRFATDSSVSAEGWYIDDVEIFTTSYDCTSALAPPGEASDPTIPGNHFEIVDGTPELLNWAAPTVGGPVADYVLYAVPMNDYSMLPGCVGALGSGTSGTASLPMGHAFLVVARNAAGEGSYGEGTSGPRDPAGAGICP